MRYVLHFSRSHLKHIPFEREAMWVKQKNLKFAKPKTPKPNAIFRQEHLSKPKTYSGWRFQPIWKILVKLEIFTKYPQIGVKIKKNWNHHPAYFSWDVQNPQSRKKWSKFPGFAFNLVGGFQPTNPFETCERQKWINIFPKKLVREKNPPKIIETTTTQSYPKSGTPKMDGENHETPY